MNPFGLLLVPEFGFLDRFWGSPDKFLGKKVVISLIAIFVTCAIYWLVRGGHWGEIGGLFGVCWLIWRSIPFFGSSQCPRTLPQVANCFLRHFIIVPLASATAFWTNLNIGYITLVFFIYAVIATILGWYYGHLTNEHYRLSDGKGGSENKYIEIVRGCFFGFILLAILNHG